MNTLEQIVGKYGYVNGLNRGTGYGNQGGDLNRHNYTKFYTLYFESIRNEFLNILEIGVFKGRGIATLSDYFYNSSVYGLDLSNVEFELSYDELVKMGAFTNDNLKGVYSGDSTKSETWDEEVHNFPQFDIIVDDGLHRLKAQYETFTNFWPKLKKNGTYLIEDVLPSNSDQLKKLIENSDFGKEIVNIDVHTPTEQTRLFFLTK